MQCERCASESHEVVRTKRMRTAEGKYSPNTDVRVQRCRECGLIQHVECVKRFVEVFDEKTLRTKLVAPDEYAQIYLKRDMIRREQLHLFKDGE